MNFRFFLIILFFLLIFSTNKIQAFQALEDRQRVQTANCFKTLVFYGMATTAFLAAGSSALDAYHGSNNKTVGNIFYIVAGTVCLCSWAYIRNLIREPVNR